MRGILFDEQGNRLYSHQIKYEVSALDHMRVEQDPASWLRALTGICRKIRWEHRVDALVLTSQRSSVIPVDEQGEPLRPAIMWQDTRNTELVSELSAHEDLIYAKAGARPNTVYAGPKMMWLRRNEPQIYQEAYKLCTIADYLTAHMTGQFVTDATYGSRSLLMNLETGQWDLELLDLMEVDKEKLCTIVDPGSISGTICKSFASRSDLREGTPVVSAGGDQQCGALGQGVVGSGRIAATFGTGAFLLEQVRCLPEERRGALIYGAHALPGAYTLESSMLTCGALYDWCCRTLFPEGLEAMNREVETSQRGCSGVSMLPFFQGRGTPDWNSSARGMLAGLSLYTTRGDIARAALEAIAMEAANHVDLLEQQGGQAAAICVGGGLTNQPLFPQMLADASGRQVLRERGTFESTARGAWMSAAVTLGIVQDYEEAFAVAARASVFDPYHPDAEVHAYFQDQRERMNDLYAKVEG